MLVPQLKQGEDGEWKFRAGRIDGSQWCGIVEAVYYSDLKVCSVPQATRPNDIAVIRESRRRFIYRKAVLLVSGV